jgi:hypothetical protein
MALLETDARTLLLADAEVSEHVGTRIFLGHAPQDTPRPYIIIACEQQTTIPVHGARDSRTQGIAGVEEIIDIAVYSMEYGECRAIEWGVRAVIEGRKTDTSNSPWLLEDWSMIGPNFETQSGADQRGWEVVLSFQARRNGIWLPPA